MVPGNDDTDGMITFAKLLEALWEELRRTIGSAPTTALLRRAVAVSLESNPIFSSVAIERTGRDYAYQIRDNAKTESITVGELQGFVDNVFDLLSELTGTVLVTHLCQNPTIKKLMESEGAVH